MASPPATTSPMSGAPSPVTGPVISPSVGPQQRPGGNSGGGLGTPSPSTPGTPTSVTSGPPGPAVPSIQSLQQSNPGATTYNPTTAGAAPTVAPLQTAQASDVNTGLLGKATAAANPDLASINNGQINPNDSTNAASQLDAITKANSPYIQLAEQQGLLSAASRGLENSSIGAGAAESAAVQAAAPLAEQNAGEASQGALQTQQLQTQTSEQNAAQLNAALEQNSQLNTQAAEFNSSQDAAAKELEAQLMGQTSQFNASQTQSASATNAAAANQMKAQTMALNEDINKQYLSGTQAMDLASIQGQFNQLIQSNSAASSLYNAYFASIGSVMANKDIDPQRVAESIQAQQAMLESGLSLIDQINGMQLDLTQPNVAGGGGFGAPEVPYNPPGGLRNPPTQQPLTGAGGPYVSGGAGAGSR